MSIIGFLIILIVVGAGLYLLGLAPLDPTIKRIIYVLVIVVLIIYAIIFLAGLAGMSTGLPGGRLR